MIEGSGQSFQNRVKVVTVHKARGPRGVVGGEGPQGPQGDSFEMRGSWSPGTTYAPLDAVTWRSSALAGVTSLYIQKSTSPTAVSNTAPNLDLGRWSEIGAVDTNNLFGGIWEVHQTNHGFTMVGQPAGYSLVSNRYIPADSRRQATVALGLVREIVSPDIVILQSTGEVEHLDADVIVDVDQTWAPGQIYYVSVVPGRLSASPPTDPNYWAAPILMPTIDESGNQHGIVLPWAPTGGPEQRTFTQIVGHNKFYYTPNAPTTTITGVDDEGNTLSYQIGDEVEVFVNGANLFAGGFTADDGVNVVLATSVTTPDTVEVWTPGAYAITPLPTTALKIDNIEDAFNGGDRDFPVMVTTVPVALQSTVNVRVWLDGASQEPLVDYEVIEDPDNAGMSLVRFLEPPAAGTRFWGLVLKEYSANVADWNTLANKPATFPSAWATTSDKPLVAASAGAADAAKVPVLNSLGLLDATFLGAVAPNDIVDTAANFTSLNPILLNKQRGRESDTGLEKVGDGTTAWNSMVYRDVQAMVPALKLVKQALASVGATHQVLTYLADQIVPILLNTSAAGALYEAALQARSEAEQTADGIARRRLVFDEASTPAEASIPIETAVDGVFGRVPVGIPAIMDYDSWFSGTSVIKVATVKSLHDLLAPQSQASGSGVITLDFTPTTGNCTSLYQVIPMTGARTASFDGITSSCSLIGQDIKVRFDNTTGGDLLAKFDKIANGITTWPFNTDVDVSVLVPANASLLAVAHIVSDDEVRIRSWEPIEVLPAPAVSLVGVSGYYYTSATVPVDVPLPVGCADGDTLVYFQTRSATTPYAAISGATLQGYVQQAAGTQGQAHTVGIVTKVLDATDISNGFITITTGNNTKAIIMAVFRNLTSLTYSLSPMSSGATATTGFNRTSGQTGNSIAMVSLTAAADDSIGLSLLLRGGGARPNTVPSGMTLAGRIGAASATTAGLDELVIATKPLDNGDTIGTNTWSVSGAADMQLTTFSLVAV